MGILSWYVIGMFGLTCFTLWYFGRMLIMRAAKNLWESGMMNMETLVAIGCTSSMVMSVFMIISDTISGDSGMKMDNINIKIGELVHMLETASLILTIMTVGKFQESKVKKSILEMSNELFPEEELLLNMRVNLVEPKNKRFDIAVSKEIEVSYLDRDDFVRLIGPFRLLNDVVVVHVYEENILLARD